MNGEIINLEVESDGTSRHSWRSLGGDFLSVLLGLGLESVVFFDSGEEVASTGALSDVFSSDVESLFDFSVSDFLVDNDTD